MGIIILHFLSHETTLILLVETFKAKAHASLWDLPGTKSFLHEHHLTISTNTKSSFTSLTPGDSHRDHPSYATSCLNAGKRSHLEYPQGCFGWLWSKTQTDYSKQKENFVITVHLQTEVKIFLSAQDWRSAFQLCLSSKKQKKRKKPTVPALHSWSSASN